ncbi:phage head closure protein [Xenorhabdus griffiniae]|uniref:phage head closure protein n=1 Tax=Xenorhabdus griffiniae TaxID=351672 RepID=UPI002358428E|nr:phage head closure protein [Xenorhabdus griffiniae]MDC9604953.1 phage head closure protein [Xenorhabdus griffiniae]
MRAGTLRHRIKLFRPVITQGELGAEIIKSEYITTVWAKVKAMSNRKIRTADQQHVVEVQQFTVRPRKDVEPHWLVEHQGRLFTVRAIDRNCPDRAIITTEADVRHDRV